MTYSVFIDGAAGTTGLQVHDRLQKRIELSVYVLDDRQRKDADARAKAMANADVTILCLPDEAAIQAAQICLLYTSPSPRDSCASRMPSSA